MRFAADAVAVAEARTLVDAMTALALVLGVASALDAPARQSFVSEIVGPDDLTNAVGLNSASFNAARLVGPGLAGLLVAAFGGGVAATGWV